MKKALLIGLALGLAVALAAPAMAADLSVNGMIGISGQIFKNAEEGNPLPADRVNVVLNDQVGSYVASRARLIFTLRASEDLYGVFGFKMDYHQWGAQPTWGSGGLAGAGQGPGSYYAQVGGQVRGIEIQNVFIDFRVPPKLPIWLRVGMQPIFERGWVFACFDAPGITMRVNIDPIKLAITGYYLKVLDDSSNATAVNGMWSSIYGGELYGVDAAIPVSMGPVHIRPGMFFFYQDLRTNGLAWATPIGPPVTLGYLFNPADTDAMKFFWLGFFIDGKVGPINTQLDFIYNGGTIDRITFPDQHINSFLFRGQFSYVFKKLEFGVGGMYVRGEDSDGYSMQSFFLPGGFYGSECYPVLGDFLVWTDGWMGTSAFPGPGIGDVPKMYMPGFWDVRGFAYYNVFDWMKIGVNIGYIGDTVSGAGLYGQPQDAVGTDGNDDSSIGWEFDVGLGLQIYKNLSLNSGFGYLVAHKALSLGVGEPAPRGPAGRPNDPWVIKSLLMYTF